MFENKSKVRDIKSQIFYRMQNLSQTEIANNVCLKSYRTLLFV